jgi:hypothetical protein
MVLDNLAFLDASMRAVDCRAARFTVRCDGAQFSVVYLNDTLPQELLIFRLDPKRWVRIAVQKGHDLDPRAFRPLLEAHVAVDAPLTPELRRSLDSFALAIPRVINGVERASPDVVLQHSLDVEEPTKVHFSGWQPLPGPECRAQNPKLQKTRRAFGQDVYELCLHLHVSSQWTEDIKQRVAFALPE